MYICKYMYIYIRSPDRSCFSPDPSFSPLASPRVSPVFCFSRAGSQVAAGEAEVRQTFCVDIDVCRCSLSPCSLETCACVCAGARQDRRNTCTHAHSQVSAVLVSELLLRSALLRCCLVCVCMFVCDCELCFCVSRCAVAGYRGGRGGGGYGGGGGGGRYDDRYVSPHAACAPRFTFTAERATCMKAHAAGVCQFCVSSGRRATEACVCVCVCERERAEVCAWCRSRQWLWRRWRRPLWRWWRWWRWRLQ